MGNGMRVNIGVDPWVGRSDSYTPPKEVIEISHQRGIYYLAQEFVHLTSFIWLQEWKIT
jgi:hypothetical protein